MMKSTIPKKEGKVMRIRAFPVSTCVFSSSPVPGPGPGPSVSPWLKGNWTKDLNLRVRPTYYLLLLVESDGKETSVRKFKIAIVSKTQRLQFCVEQFILIFIHL